MATRKVLQKENEILRKVSKPVEKFDEALFLLINDMIETTKSYKGIGLAAPQIGVLRRVVILKDEDKYIELINPEIVKEKGEQINYEGCLSVSEVYKKVKRPFKVTAKAQDRYGNQITITGEDELAACICHEIDHLDGILFIDIAEEGDEEDEE